MTAISKLVASIFKTTSPTERYKKYILKCQTKSLPDIIDNSSLAHAQIITQSLIKLATNKKLPIRIISGSLYEGFWNSHEGLLEVYFKEVGDKASIELIILNGFIDKLRSDLKKNPVFKLLKSNEKLNKVTIQHGIPHRFVTNQAHFVLVGTKAYRRERDQNPEVSTASFNDDINGRWLYETFDFVTNYIDNESIITKKAS